MRVVVVTWGPGGNLPPLLAAAAVLGRRGHEVSVLGSGETRGAAERLGLRVLGYRHSPDPDVRIAFEAQAGAMMATMAGEGIALDAVEVLEEQRPDLAIVDCMLPAGIAAAQATGTPVASLVHFLYGLARTRMLADAGAWTTDLEALAATHRRLGLEPIRDGLSAWDAPELVLVTAPRWLDLDTPAPDHVVHAGPLDVRRHSRGTAGRPAVLVSFSTTVMDGQPKLVERACEALAGLDLDVTLTLGPALDAGALRVPDGIRVLDYADHDRLMPGCGAVISHGGLGTVLRALAHGVPQLLLPLGRDQGFNASRVEQLGAGLALPADSPPARIRAAVRTLLDEERFRAAAARLAQRIAAEDPDRTAAEALERAAQR
jgi:UDP:flavonoid glycosyltransferase YjiC (YdhE family)